MTSHLLHGSRNDPAHPFAAWTWASPRSKPPRAKVPRAGFTLVELLVVISVVTVLLAILLPSLGRAREDARRTVCLANLKHVGVGLFAYADANRDAGPQVMPPLANNRAPRTLLSVPDAMVNLGLMSPTEVAEPDLFRCPSQRQFNYADDPGLFKSNLVAGSYAYAVHLPAAQSPRFARFRHLAMVADDFAAAYGDDGIGKHAHRVLYNVLYTDGSAARYADPGESIWKRHVYWDDESDEYDYASFYGELETNGNDTDHGERYADIFRVWHAFCYSQPDPFGGIEVK